MSCNGCRILRRGCSEDCMLRQCIQWMGNPQAQANATVFVAKFFGRAGLMSFISSVSQIQRPSLFQSLLFEAVGRTVNPVSGAVGLLWTGNWHLCQKAVMKVLRGDEVEPLPELDGGGFSGPESDKVSECGSTFRPRDHVVGGSDQTSKEVKTLKRKRSSADNYPVASSTFGLKTSSSDDLDLCLMYRRMETPSSEESEITTTLESGSGNNNCGFREPKLLRLLV